MFLLLIFFLSFRSFILRPARYFDSRGIKTVELDGTRPWVKNVETLLELPMLKSICYEHVHEERHRQKQDARTTWEEESA